MPRKGGVPENLKSFPKGKSGNPNGRPKKLPEIDKLMSEVLGSEDEDGKNSKALAILNALVKQAKKGNTRAAEILLDRGYGKPKESIVLEANVKSYKIVPASNRGTGNSSE